MVQRTGLALILLLTMAVSFLLAQEIPEFTPPRMLSEPILELPDSLRTPAKDVLILVEVKPDSTATLVKILDGKEELKAYIEYMLPYLMFVPATKKGDPFTSNLTIKFTVSKLEEMQEPVTKAVSDSLKKVDKDLLISGIKDRMEDENLQRMFSSDTLYRTNYYLMGLNKDSALMIKDGFIQPPHVYYQSLDYQILSNFRSHSGSSFSNSIQEWPVAMTTHVIEVPRVESGSYSATEPVYNPNYPWPAMCTDLYAGLGDYEFNFAKGQVLKNHLFGVKDFYGEFGFLVQNGWWQEVISDQTSMRMFMKVPLPFYGTNLLFNYESYDQNIPSTTLLPGLQNGSIFRIGQKLQSIFFKWELPWFTVGWQSSKEKLSAPGILNRQEFTSGSFLLEDALNFLDTDFNLSYQYNGKAETPQVQSLYQYNKQTKHQGLIKINHEHNTFKSDNQLLVSENGLEKADVHLSNNFNASFGVGLNYHYFNGEHNTKSIHGLYVDTTVVYFPSAFIKHSVMADIKWLASESIYTKLNAGIKQIDRDIGVIVPNGNSIFSNNYPSAEFELNAYKELGKFIASLDQTLQWIQYDKNLYEQPEFTGQTRLKLVRELPYHNALSAGLNLAGHTDYIQADSQNLPIYGSMIADAWLGVKITDLFEFQLMMKNLNNNVIFGLSPHPRTIIGTIHWFYLN